MLHGNPSWSFYYRRLAQARAVVHRVIVPDHVGCGLSSKPSDSEYDFSLERRIGDLEALLNHLALDAGLTLVVHDWGGAIGLGFATRHPERIARLIILNTAAFHLPRTKSFPWPLWLCRDTPLGAWLVRGINAFCRGTALVGCRRQPMPRAIRNAYLAPYDSWAHRIAIHRFVQDIPLGPGDRCYDVVSRIEERLPLLASRPMLIAWGMRDFVFDRHFLEEWQRRFPAAELHRFPEAGHYVLEDEHERLIPLIGSFLAAHPASRAIV
jgi:haloalkane dehalogenase